MVNSASILLLWLLPLLVSAPAMAQSARVSRVLQAVSAPRIEKDVADLAGLGSRFALSPEFLKATRMVQDKLTAAGLTVTLDPLMAGDHKVHNVLAVLKGSVPGRPTILLGAHYDSINTDEINGAAPGAEDNASGTAALLEVARLLASEKLATDVTFVAFAAEEEGLWGSRQMANSLKERGITGTVQAVINMDMVGYNPQGKKHLLIDSFRSGRSLAARVGLAAQTYVASVRAAGGIFSEGRSDHLPFVELDIEAVTLASEWWHHYPHYHTSGDLPRHVDPKMVAEVARVAAATVLLRAGFADGPPVAHAGRFVEVDLGQRVELSASGSFDPLGKALSYSWTQTGGAALTTTSTGARLSFVPREAGTYRFQLVVKTPDGRVSQPDVVAAMVTDDEGCSLGGPALAGHLTLLVLLLLVWFPYGRGGGVRARR